MEISIFTKFIGYKKYPQYHNEVAVVKATAIKDGFTFEATGIADEIMEAEDIATQRAIELTKLLDK